MGPRGRHHRKQSVAADEMEWLEPREQPFERTRPRDIATEQVHDKSLAREVAASGVTVNGVAPGSILWEGGGWHRRQQADPEGIAEFIRHEMPLGRFGTVDEVAGVVAFVCSKQASLLSGASIAVDGAQGRSNI